MPGESALATLAKSDDQEEDVGWGVPVFQRWNIARARAYLSTRIDMRAQQGIIPTGMCHQQVLPKDHPNRLWWS